jgi:photosystem II protein
VLSGGQGALSQLSYLACLPEATVGLFLAGLVGFNLAAGLAPNSATFAPEQVAANEADAADGPLRNPKVTLFQVKKFFGVTDWGFTPQNELFAGRLAQLGFAAALLGEVATGLGPLGQLAAGERGRGPEMLLFRQQAAAGFALLGCY